MKCSICGKEYNGFGNNSAPLKREKCCDDCNNQIVIPLRIYLSGMNKKQALLIEPSGIISIANPNKPDEFGLVQLQEMVEGYIELYPKQDNDFVYIVNEEGIIKGLPFNMIAYELFGIEIVGNLIVCPKELFN